MSPVMSEASTATLAAKEMSISPMDKFREFLQTKGMRLTPEREAVVAAVYATHDHFDAEQWVGEMARRSGSDRASRSTVYRTLNLLEEAGLIRRVARAHDREVYEHDYGYPHHDHLICKKCGTMIEFPNDAISAAVAQIAAQHGFRMTGHRLEVEGLCARCSQPPERKFRKLDMI